MVLRSTCDRPGKLEVRDSATEEMVGLVRVNMRAISLLREVTTDKHKAHSR